MSSNNTEQAFRYEADGKIVEVRPGDTFTRDVRSGSGWYTKRYKIHSIGEDGISYTMSFEGNFLDRSRDDPTLFGTTPVEKGDARYVDTDIRYYDSTSE